MNEQYSAMRSNVSMLGKLLGDTIKDALGENILDQVETIRKLSKSSRAGNDTHRKELLNTLQNLSNEELHHIFLEWNKGDLDSFLIEITAAIFSKKDEDDQQSYILDKILDCAGQKGTGKWTVNAALDFGIPVTLISEAVFARCLSALKEQRVHASHELPAPHHAFHASDKAKLIAAARDALYAAKLVSYAQGFTLFRATASELKWNLNYGGIALMWRGGCIIRSKFLAKIKEAFDANPQLDNLLLAPYFKEKVTATQNSWRYVVATAALNGIPIPAISTALAYYDGLRTARLPANLLQAQRDYFGAHTYERTDKPRGEFFHTNWTGHGGTTHAGQYGNASH